MHKDNMISKVIKNVILIFFMQVIIYVLLFIIFSIYIHTTFEVLMLIGLCIISMVLYIVLLTKYNFNYLELMLGIVPMWLLSYLYHPHSLFGISDGQNELDLFSAKIDALIFACVIFLIQVGIKLFLKVLCYKTTK